MVRRVLIAHSYFNRTDRPPQWKAYFGRHGFELETVTNPGGLRRLLVSNPCDLLIVGSSLGSVGYEDMIALAREINPEIRVAVYSNITINTEALGVDKLAYRQTLPQIFNYVRSCLAPRPSQKKK